MSMAFTVLSAFTTFVAGNARWICSPRESVLTTRKLVIYDANHGVFGYARTAVVNETLDWLDRYVGPVT